MVGELSEADTSFLLLHAFYHLRSLLDRLIDEGELGRWIQPGMGPLLYSLYDGDRVTVSEIARNVRLSLSRVTITLKRMEENGLVKLTREPTDRRVVRVRLTARARALEARMQVLRGKVQEILHHDMDSSSVDATKRGLATLIQAMELHKWHSRDPRKKESR